MFSFGLSYLIVFGFLIVIISIWNVHSIRICLFNYCNWYYYHYSFVKSYPCSHSLVYVKKLSSYCFFVLKLVFTMNIGVSLAFALHQFGGKCYCNSKTHSKAQSEPNSMHWVLLCLLEIPCIFPNYESLLKPNWFRF